MDVRPPAVAGVLYPAESEQLRTVLRQWLRSAHPQGPAPKALIVPHAPYQHAGPVVANAYARLAQDRPAIRRIILLGPAHFVRLAGIALSSADAFATPLGELEVDRHTVDRLAELPNVDTEDLAHAFEHSLETQLPFLQETLEHVAIVPLVVGDISPEQIALLLTVLWGGPETRIIVSSDLSHTADRVTTETLDETTAQSIESLQRPGVVEGGACGREAINGLLWVARVRHMHVDRLGLGHSHPAAGSDDRVTGFGAFAFTELD